MCEKLAKNKIYGIIKIEKAIATEWLALVRRIKAFPHSPKYREGFLC